MRKQKGSISIYLSIIFLSMIVLISVLAERARISIIQSKCKAVTYMATESVLAGYGKQIFEDYGLLLAWENQSTSDILKSYMQANINKADLKGTGTNFMDNCLVDIGQCKVDYIVNNNGTSFINQIKNYVEYAGLLNGVDKLMQDFSGYNESNEIEKNNEKKNIAAIVDKDSAKIQSIAEEVIKEINNLKNINSLESQYKGYCSARQNKKIKKLLKTSKKIISILNEKEKTVGKVISLINNYEKEKEKFLENLVDDYSGGNSIEKNLEILEIVEDKIIDIQGLNISNISKLDKKSMQRAKLFENNLNEIIKEINSLIINEATEKDKENFSIYETLKTFFNSGIVSLVIEDTSNISNRAISTLNLPSISNDKYKEGELRDKSILITYGNIKFGNYLESKTNTALKYEMEYLIAGKDNDFDNLSEVVKKLIAIRNTVNTSVILMDKEKIQMAESIAKSVAIVLKLPFMESIAKAFILEAWILAESIYEVKSLLIGNKIPIVKKSRDWNIDINNLFKKPSKNKNSKGIDYTMYCNLIMLSKSCGEISYRMMDLIQENIQQRYNPDFLIAKCFTNIEVTTKFGIDPLFMAMPWTMKMKTNDLYNFQITLENSY